MDVGGRVASGRTLGLAEGFPSTLRAQVVAPLRRWAAAVIVSGGLIAAAAAMSASLVAQANPGVAPPLQGGIVESVAPAGFAWRAGIRAGQVVVGLSGLESPGVWRLETWDGAQRHVATAAGVDATLRDGFPLALTAFLVACLAFLLLRRASAVAIPAACVAFLAASQILQLQGDPDVSTASLTAAAFVPTASLAARLTAPLILRGLVTTAGLTLVVSWTIASLAGHPAAATLEILREALATAATGVLFTLLVVASIRSRHLPRVELPGVADVVVVAGIATLVLAAILSRSVHPVVVLVILIAAPWVGWVIRRAGGERIGAALVPQLVERASIDAREKERARIAGELHDVPLQQLAGVIHRLDAVPGAGVESDELRSVARQLRSMAELERPPALDDLGLAAALDALARGTTTVSTPVRVAVADTTRVEPATRPPEAVELAILRIAQEAVANAVRHARATAIAITGAISRDRVEISVIDDGAGLPPDAERDAARRGRMGLSSMRQRARSVGAELSIEASSDGTAITVRWHRR